MQFFFKPKTLNNYTEWAFYNNVFTEDECKLIKSLFKNYEKAKVVYDNNPETTNSDTRSSLVSWIDHGSETDWIFRRISEFAQDCNYARYDFDITGFSEPLQLAKYNIDDYFDWHQDMGSAFSWRKLSIIVQLSDESEYEGGQLEFCGNKCKAPSKIGDLVVFPSYVSHRVTPITNGERYSLVGWISGPPYR